MDHGGCRFTPPMYAPALGFLMFAVGVNLKVQAFAQVLQAHKVRASGGHIQE